VQINFATYQVLPFYDSVDKQNFKQEWLHNDVNTCYLIAPKNRLLPFQIQRSTRYNPPTNLDLYTYTGVFVKSLLTEVDITDFTLVTAGSIDIINNNGNKDLDHNLDCGLYYLVASDGIQTLYSEIFRVVDFTWGTTPLPVHINHENLPLESAVGTPIHFYNYP